MRQRHAPSSSLPNDRPAGGRSSLVGEFFTFLRQHVWWWLLPIVVILVVLGAIVMLGGTSMAPFLYS